MLTIIGIIMMVIGVTILIIDKIMNMKLIAEQKNYIRLLEAKINEYVRNGIHD